MANLTVTVNEHVLKRERIKALEQGTSVNSLVSDYLTRFAGTGATQQALGEFLEIAERSHASSGPDGRSWQREELYDRAVLQDRA